MIIEERFIVDGPYQSGQEAAFKRDVIAARERKDPALRHFRIETAETEPGFPDVIAIRGRSYHLIEFKVSDKNGVITFKKSQPLFYRKYRDVRITVLAWDVPNRRLLAIGPDDAAAYAAETGSLRFPLPKGRLPRFAADLSALLPGALENAGLAP
jgi:hypothetical protein